jgi:hypothetical protein
MESKHFFKWMIAGASFTAMAAGCGDDILVDPGTGGAGGNATTTTTTTVTVSTTTTTTTTTVSGTGGTGGVPDDGNNSFETAEDLAIDGDAAQAELDPVETDEDYYVFQGTAGQVVSVLTDAKPANMPSAEGFPDLVITLYNEAQEQIAQNDDTVLGQIQDSTLYTILPATGTYYIKVEEFCASDLATSPCPPGYFDTITEPAYAVGVFSIDAAAENGTVVDEEGMLTPMEYEPTGDPNAYFATLVYGDFVDNVDSDVFTFSLPDDLVAAERILGHAEIQPAGTAGNGSLTSVGVVQFVNATTLEVVAEVDAQLGGELSPPLDLLTDYQLVVTHPGGGNPVGPTAFYFLLHRGGDSNPLEAEVGTGTNDTLATSEDPPASGNSYFTEGDLLPAGPLDADDQDFFNVAVPAGAIGFSVSCGGQRSGSGLRGLTATVLRGSNGMPLAGGTATENEVNDLLIQDLPPGAETALVVKIEAASQAANVTSTFYRCGFHFDVP